MYLQTEITKGINSNSQKVPINDECLMTIRDSFVSKVIFSDSYCLNIIVNLLFSNLLPYIYLTLYGINLLRVPPHPFLSYCKVLYGRA